MSQAERVFGRHAVAALLDRAPDRVTRLLLQTGVRGGELEALAERAGIPVARRPRTELDALAADGRHQGVIAEARPARERGERELRGDLENWSSAALVLVLDGIQDPRNLGACLRTAAAAGANAVVIPRDRAAGLTAAARKTAAGAAEALAVYRVTNLARALRLLRDAGVWLVGAEGGATDAVYDVDLSGPLALVLGAEGRGLRRLTREHCDRLVRIPLDARVESLNVAVAAGVCLFETARQRRLQRPGG